MQDVYLQRASMGAHAASVIAINARRLDAVSRRMHNQCTALSLFFLIASFRFASINRVPRPLSLSLSLSLRIAFPQFSMMRSIPRIPREIDKRRARR